MPLYVDGFLIPIPKKNVAAYRKIAKQAGKIWRELGALEYRECLGDDLDGGMPATFPRQMKLKKGETLAFSWIVYRSRAHRDSVNVKVMKDPRIAKMMKDQSSPFDMKRMLYGGFKVVVDA